MKVTVKLTPTATEPYAVIYAAAVDDEVRQATEWLGAPLPPVLAEDEKGFAVLRPEDIYLARVENGETLIYGKEQVYRSKKRLYELEEQLGRSFLRISKSALVHLRYLAGIEAGFGGALLLKMKNGERDYVSRKYLPALKRYLGQKGALK